LVWTSLYVPYKIYICEYCISQLQILFIALSILRISSTWAVANNSLKHVHTQPATQPRCRSKDALCYASRR